MKRTIFVLLTALTAISAVSFLEDFCITILKQTADDTNMCAEKARTNSFKDTRDDAVIAYLCCLGGWNDVTNIYSVFLDNNFMLYVSYQTNVTVLNNIASFVYMCTQNATPGDFTLTTANFLYWGNHTHDASNCRLS